jgi:hypothetical protein
MWAALLASSDGSGSRGLRAVGLLKDLNGRCDPGYTDPAGPEPCLDRTASVQRPQPGAGPFAYSQAGVLVAEPGTNDVTAELTSQTPSRLQAAFLFALVLLCTVLALIAILLIRSGFFNFAAPITNTQYKALWTFLASALGAAVTLIGLTLTHSHNARTLALQADVANRQSMAEQEVESRQKLETVVKGLQLISTAEGKYAVSAQVAGSLASLVHLRHPVVAMRALRAAWSDGQVDVGTAVWLINEVLVDGSPASQVEASALLCEHAADLCNSQKGRKGEVTWPSVLYTEWLTHPPRACRFEILFTIVRVVLSRDKAWWGYNYDWAVVLLDEAMKKDPDPVLRDCACHLLRPVVESYASKSNVRKDIQLPWGDGVKKLPEIEKGVIDHQGVGRITAETRNLVKELEGWRRRVRKERGWRISNP